MEQMIVLTILKGHLKINFFSYHIPESLNPLHRIKIVCLKTCNPSWIKKNVDFFIVVVVYSPRSNKIHQKQTRNSHWNSKTKIKKQNAINILLTYLH